MNQSDWTPNPRRVVMNPSRWESIGLAVPSYSAAGASLPHS